MNVSMRWITRGTGVILILSAILMFAVMGTGGVARAWSGDDDLPSGEELWDKAHEAAGGKAAFDKIKNRVSKGTLSLPAQGIEGTITVYEARPNRTYTEFTIAGMDIKRGVDGEVAWELSPMTGPRVMGPEETGLYIRHGTWDFEEQKKFYKSIECVGVEKVGGVDCYKVIATPHEGKPETTYFSKETHLPVKMEMTVMTAMGAIDVESLIGDYREVDGIKVPVKVTEFAMGQEQIVVIESVEHNVDLPDGLFSPPPEIQALIK